MRFLCLHGLGTNSNIFETQVSQIRAQLDASCEFVFLDGEIECPPAPGISSIFPGPYLCYHPSIPTESELLAAYSLVENVLEEEGPFDGLLGFSQGAALCASVLLKGSTKIGARKSLPVKCAVFICGILPWTLSEPEVPTFAPARATEQHSRGYFSGDADKKSFVSVTEMEPDVGMEDSAPALNLCARVHPSTYSVRISIPTTHIVGGIHDEYFSDSRALAELGDEKRGGVRLFDHGQGHIVPRGVEVSKRMGDAILWAINRVRFRH